MAEVLFYHLTESTLEDALPGLLERSAGSAAGGLSCRPAPKSAATRSTRISGPFATIPSSPMATDREPHAAEQPVLLTTGAGNPNGADDPLPRRRRRAAGPRGYERAVFLFDGHDAGAGRGRARAVEGAEGGRPRGDLLAADAGQALGAQGVRSVWFR